jgi:ribonuclease HI
MITHNHIPPWGESNFNFLNPFKDLDKGSTADIIFQQLFRYHRQNYNGYTPVFTDGSKSGNFVSCAYVIQDKVHSHRLHPALSIFTAEILAILKCLEELSHYQVGNFIVYSDSLSALKSFCSPNHNSHPLIFHVLKQIDRLKSFGYSILFCWVPSHVGITGNETADKAAKSANDVINTAIPYSDAKKYVKQLLYKKWQSSWDELILNKLHSVKPVIQRWHHPQSRREDVILTRLRIGHTRFTHRHLLLSESAPTCETCKIIMSVKHILVDCPKFVGERSRHFIPLPSNVKDLLNVMPHPNIFAFLKGIGFYPHI